MKLPQQYADAFLQWVAPARERGLKYGDKIAESLKDSRSREGAWIEITPMHVAIVDVAVAPARERGLKCKYSCWKNQYRSRSREGAWIEI